MTKNKYRIIICFLITVSCISLARSQESTNSSGGDATGNGGSVAYSIGQIFYTTNLGSNGSKAQGVQQAFEVFTLDIKDWNFKTSFTIFPNPTIDKLVLKISNYSNQKLSYQLYDFQGRVLSNSEIVSELTELNMDGLPTAAYLLYILNQDNKRVKKFKVIKK
jgi:hypothetical protein